MEDHDLKKEFEVNDAEKQEIRMIGAQYRRYANEGKDIMPPVIRIVYNSN
jgi:hypothetical protein